MPEKTSHRFYHPWDLPQAPDRHRFCKSCWWSKCRFRASKFVVGFEGSNLLVVHGVVFSFVTQKKTNFPPPNSEINGSNSLWRSAMIRVFFGGPWRPGRSQSTPIGWFPQNHPRSPMEDFTSIDKAKEYPHPLDILRKSSKFEENFSDYFRNCHETNKTGTAISSALQCPQCWVVL